MRAPRLRTYQKFGNTCTKYMNTSFACEIVQSLKEYERSQRQRALQPRGDQRRASHICLHFLTFQTLEFWQPLLPGCFQSHICDRFNFSAYSFTINMKHNSVKRLQSINFPPRRRRLRIYVAQRLIQLFLSHHQAERKLMWQDVTLLNMLNIRGYVAVLKESSSRPCY
jgi:hypothetical protein